MSRILISAALAAIVAVPTVRAQTTNRQAPANAPTAANAQAAADQAPINDALFAQAAAASGMSEVAVGEIGERKATDPQLKEFSQRVVADHGKMNQELMDLAARKGIALPAQIDPRGQFAIHSLGGEPTDTFDRCYAKAQMAIHLEAMGVFEAEAKRGQDPELKALAAKALPKIKEHLNMLKPIAKKYEEERQGQLEGGAQGATRSETETPER